VPGGDVADAAVAVESIVNAQVVGAGDAEDSGHSFGLEGLDQCIGATYQSHYSSLRSAMATLMG